MSPARVRSAPGDFHPSAIAHADDQLGLEPVRLADQLSLVEVETSKEIVQCILSRPTTALTLRFGRSLRLFAGASFISCCSVKTLSTCGPGLKACTAALVRC